MTFKKGHPPYPKKGQGTQASAQTETLSKPPKSDVEIATGLLEGVTLSPMNPNAAPADQHEETRRLVQTVGREMNKEKANRSSPSTSTPSSDGVEGIMPLLVRALERIAEGQEDSREAAKAALDRAHKTQFPQGAKRGREISMFNPQGDTKYPRPDLKCKMFLPWQAEKETLTVEEIRLLNLLEDGDYRVKRNDGTRMTITVKIQTNSNNGKPERLLMNSETGFSNLRHRQCTPLSTMLREMLMQRPHLKEAAAAVPTMDAMYEAVAAGELPVSDAVEY